MGWGLSICLQLSGKAMGTGLGTENQFNSIYETRYVLNLFPLEKCCLLAI